MGATDEARKGEETMDPGFRELSCPSCGRWGEVEKEKGPVDLFPTEPTDEARKGEETLDPGFRNSLPFVRKMG